MRCRFSRAICTIAVSFFVYGQYVVLFLLESMVFFYLVTTGWILTFAHPVRIQSTQSMNRN